MQVLMVGALPKWRGDGHLSSVESQLPYVSVNLEAHRQAFRGTQQQVRGGSAIRNHRRPHRATDDCRPHRIPTGQFLSPVTIHPDPCAPPRNVTAGTAPSGGRRAARTATTRWPKIAHRGPPRTPSAHRPERATGRRPRASPIETGLLRAVPNRPRSCGVHVGESRCCQLAVRRRRTGQGARPGTARAPSAPGPRHGE